MCYYCEIYYNFIKIGGFMIKKMNLIQGILGIVLTLAVTHKSSAMMNYQAQQNKRKINDVLNQNKKITIKKKKIHDTIMVEITINLDNSEKTELLESFIIPLHTIDLTKHSKRKINQERDSKNLLPILFRKKYPKIVKQKNDPQVEEIKLFDN